MPKVSRRDFLGLVGAGGGGVGLGLVFGHASVPTARLLVPQPVMPEDYSPGASNWYSTVCRECPAGCGIVVRTFEGRAKKIEGNPLHPVSQGRSCPLGQAALNVLYHPDRLRTPRTRVGARGAGEFIEAEWADALQPLTQQLQALRQAGRGNSMVMLSGHVRGHLDSLFARFADEVGGAYLQYEFAHPTSLYAANERCFGSTRIPYYDIAHSDYLLSFGADYLAQWLSPVQHSRAYGRMRQGRPGRRGYCVQVEPRMSLTGANADEWLPARPGSEGVLALAIARELVHNGRYQGDDRDRWTAVLEPYDVETAAAHCDLEANRIAALAQAFAQASHPLALGGGAAACSVNGTANLIAVNLLNHLCGALGAPGGVLFNPPAPFAEPDPARVASFARMQQLIEQARDGAIDVLIVHDTNPAFHLPQAVQFAEALQNVPLVVYAGSFVDETAALADVILPMHCTLESWGDDVPEPGVGFPVATVAQPAVAPLYDTRSAGDLILSLADALGLGWPWRSDRDYIRESWRGIHRAHNGAGEDLDFDEFWRTALQSGVWGLFDQAASQGAGALQPAVLEGLELVSVPADDARPYSLQPYLSPVFQDGRGAKLPWLQELADPTTGVVYGSWFELHPATAQELGVRDGDVLEVSSVHGALQAPVVIYPAVRPDVIAVPIGQGHTQSGRYARGRGINPLSILEPQLDELSGALAWAATRVSAVPTGRRMRVIRQGGVSRDLGRGILGRSG